MTATAASPSSTAATPGRPSTTRVTVLTGRRMTDLVLPSATPIESYVDETVSVLADILADTPADALAGFDFKAQGVWSFARPGAPPIKHSASLDDAGVVDGSLLTLVPVSRTERYRPLVEDVIDAIAVLDETPEFDRRALYRFVGLMLPLAALTVTAVAVLSWASTGRHWWWAVALAVLGAALMGASVLAQKRFQHADMAESLLVAALIGLTGAATLGVPLPRGVDSLGAPQVAGAGAVVLLIVLATRGGPRRRAEIAAFLAVVALAVTLAAVAFGYGWDSWVPAGAIAFGLVVVTNAAKLTVAVARIALPPIPAPGETVSNDELLDPVATTDTSEESETWQAIIASVPDSAARLTERTHLAKRLLIGFLTAGAAILTAGAVSVVVQGHFFVHSVIVAGLVAVVCGFRSRLYAERWCAWALMAAAVAIPTGVAVRLCLWYPERAWLVLTLYIAVALSAVVIIGATDGVRRMSPVTKRLLELFDGAAIAAVIPLLLWIAGVYDVLRNLRF
ncbi:type VII secretion integral membrane protein EccD [Mycolicibacterium duvalii]|uniref:Type VII secretion integral membrane protein EccD n=1 Tax=Mycolicibacterium duvalii TaxID=39688 RepID=A0A7I7K6Z4_9MYCO|nr:type VII secretion integral membrane protein EccD [Mycolicibacterium duvalii]MCV7370712.1 type VII secretion integral membrane protein EccD [Mycolicibacterium duvalii]PEG36102.1 type VII secretion integral membrane protein EccD [Mycolicibacterium duvalii]BBX19334.1 type VII secretion integral membrane protein EccD [Mycolicibacterium duvalii]